MLTVGRQAGSSVRGITPQNTGIIERQAGSSVRGITPHKTGIIRREKSGIISQRDHSSEDRDHKEGDKWDHQSEGSFLRIQGS